MASFTDANGTTWDVSITVQSIRRVREQFSIDLSKVLGDKESFAGLHDDVCQLADVLFAVCSEQANAKGITLETFGAGLQGDSLQAAREAFNESALSFLPAKKRELMRQVLDTQKKAETLAELSIQKKFDEGLLDRTVNEGLAQLDRFITEIWQDPAPMR
jgi:hypothetical protein